VFFCKYRGNAGDLTRGGRASADSRQGEANAAEEEDGEAAGLEDRVDRLANGRDVGSGIERADVHLRGVRP
jgi:hypothetical protein